MHAYGCADWSVGQSRQEPAESYTHLHGSPFMVRPRPFPRAHKCEASGGLLGTKAVNIKQNNLY